MRVGHFFKSLLVHVLLLYGVRDYPVSVLVQELGLPVQLCDVPYFLTCTKNAYL